MGKTINLLDFQDDPMLPDVFSSRVGRVELLEGNLVRLWCVTEQNEAGRLRYVLVHRGVVPLEGLLVDRRTLEELVSMAREPDRRRLSVFSH